VSDLGCCFGAAFKIWQIVYRIHWLKAKARRDRWAEEQTLLTSEMDWAIAFFRTQARRWQDRQNGVNTTSEQNDGTSIHPLSRGQICYTYRQEAIWLKFAEVATDKFNKVKEDINRSEQSGP
jgi:hypothetical protein